ncbi:unnamed protein product [Cylicocyclus nassatus]|uniref:DUF7774 domain-containing protein n=1 Tax=Cylicocyclus nassatus TaxID=53992 RepID=A0AA36M168_CYLNA|nr:unnamed protein product [Cylicocyclus nassatus]
MTDIETRARYQKLGHHITELLEKQNAQQRKVERTAEDYGISKVSAIADRTKENDEEQEEFENEKHAHPATTRSRGGLLRWKDGRQTIEKATEEEDSGSIPDENTVLMATRIVTVWNQQHLLENALDKKETRKVTDFFENADLKSSYGSMVANLIEKAVRRAIRRTITNTNENLGFTISDDERYFLMKRLRARRILLEILSKNPSLLPASWVSRAAAGVVEEGKVQEEKPKGQQPQCRIAHTRSDYGMRAHKRRNPHRKDLNQVRPYDRKKRTAKLKIHAVEIGETKVQEMKASKETEDEVSNKV